MSEDFFFAMPEVKINCEYLKEINVCLQYKSPLVINQKKAEYSFQLQEYYLLTHPILRFVATAAAASITYLKDGPDYGQ